MNLLGIIRLAGKFFEELLQPQAVIRPKSDWQEKLCINVGNGATCQTEATFEAFFQRGRLKAAVRCCASPECQAESKKIAKSAVSEKTQS
ncbi:hypothetical protein HGA34_03485 [Candidatus Falkowbacteria bacterium]|nr:hypothetical protein [Candidatus Falkowbacteria bacterium]